MLSKSARALLFILLLCIPLIPAATDSDGSTTGWGVQPAGRLQLIWLEDFEGDAINESLWNFNIGDGCPNLCGWGNAELQYYRRENAFVENGSLVIEARKELFIDRTTGKTYNYTSARLDTIGKFKISPPARIEVRARLPLGKGIWPAIWMLGEEWSLENASAWPSCGEIDIVELIGSEPDVVYGTVHAPYCYGSRGVGSRFRLPAGQDFSQGYHVFALEWTQDYIAWFVDGQLFHVITRAEFQRRGCAWAFDKPFHLVLNIAVGGYWPGKPDDTTPFPARMVIDYIKVYRVLQPDPLLMENEDSDNELLSRTIGWPKAPFEKIANGGFEEPVDPNNSPLVDPSKWYIRGDRSALGGLSVSEGVLELSVVPGSGSEKVGLSQMIWLRQGAEYEIRLKGWGDRRVNITVEISLPALPPKEYYTKSFELSEEPALYRLFYAHPLTGSNIVELTIWIRAAPGAGEEVRVYFDEIVICPVSSCPPLLTEPVTRPGPAESSTPPEASTPTQQGSESSPSPLAVIPALAAALVAILILLRKRRSAYVGRSL